MYCCTVKLLRWGEVMSFSLLSCETSSFSLSDRGIFTLTAFLHRRAAATSTLVFSRLMLNVLSGLKNSSSIHQKLSLGCSFLFVMFYIVIVFLCRLWVLHWDEKGRRLTRTPSISKDTPSVDPALHLHAQTTVAIMGTTWPL